VPAGFISARRQESGDIPPVESSGQPFADPRQPLSLNWFQFLSPLLCCCEISAVHGVAITVPTGGTLLQEGFMSHRNRDAGRALAMLCGLSDASDDGPFPIGGDSFNGSHDFRGRRYSLSVTYDFGGN
jgi:hypothetical protein